MLMGMVIFYRKNFRLFVGIFFILVFLGILIRIRMVVLVGRRWCFIFCVLVLCWGVVWVLYIIFRRVIFCVWLFVVIVKF